MRQFLVPAVPTVPASRPGAVLEIAGPDYHYLIRVLRLRPGAVIPVADAAGRRGRATLTAIDHRGARLLIAAEGAETARGPGAGTEATAAGTTARPVAAGMSASAAQPGHARQAAAPGKPATRAQATDATQATGTVAAGNPGSSAQAGRGADAAHAIGAGEAEASARVADPAALSAPGAPRAVTLIQALPKGALMDRIVRQATELGVTRIVPVVAERTQGRADDAAQARRRQRWQRIARQAAQQSGAGTPLIEQPRPLRRYLEELPAGGLNLLFHPGADPLPVAIAQAAPPLAMRCAVGPEGGFSPAEAALFGAHGFRAVGLPTGLLRVDTAAVAALVTGAQFLLSLHAAPNAH